MQLYARVAPSSYPWHVTSIVAGVVGTVCAVAGDSAKRTPTATTAMRVSMTASLGDPDPKPGLVSPGRLRHKTHVYSAESRLFPAGAGVLVSGRPGVGPRASCVAGSGYSGRGDRVNSPI